MSAEIAEVGPSIAAQQAEVDDDPAADELGDVVPTAGSFARRGGFVFSFVVGRHVRPTVRHGLKPFRPSSSASIV
jgi:hypothetical protein